MSNITRSDDGTIPEGGAISQWTGYFDQVSERIGIAFHAAEDACQAIKNAGFVNVTERIVKVPVGCWAKDKRLKAWGSWFQYFVLEGLEGFVIRSFTEVLGVSTFLADFEPVKISSLAFLTRYPCVCSGPMRRLKSTSLKCEKSSKTRESIFTANGTRPFHYRSWVKALLTSVTHSRIVYGQKP